MKNVWLERKKQREGVLPQIITVHQALPQELNISPMTINVDWSNVPSSITMFQCGLPCSTVQWDGPGLPPSITVNTHDMCPIIVDGIQLPKEINVSSFNQGIC